MIALNPSFNECALEHSCFVCQPFVFLLLLQSNGLFRHFFVFHFPKGNKVVIVPIYFCTYVVSVFPLTEFFSGIFSLLLRFSEKLGIFRWPDADLLSILIMWIGTHHVNISRSKWSDETGGWIQILWSLGHRPEPYLLYSTMRLFFLPVNLNAKPHIVSERKSSARRQKNINIDLNAD